MTTSVTVEFGSVTFTGAEIKSARLVEEIDPISIELPINTIELVLFSTAVDFSILSPEGFFANLKYKQPLDVYENFDGSPVYLGKFYLDEWESLSENEARFLASDAIGILESKTCLGWEMPEGIVDSDTIVGRMETETGVTISLHSSLENINLRGWIPVATYREALQQLCFLLGAYATCSRSDQVNILPTELISQLTAYDHTLTAADKGLGEPIILLPLVTGVDVDAHIYNTDDAVSEQVFEDTLSVGTHRIIFDGPKLHDSFTLTGATDVTAIGANNYMDMSVAVAGLVTLSMPKFVDSLKTYSVTNTALPTGTRPNILKISDATLVAPGIVNGIDPRDVVSRVYNYYQQRYLQKAKFYGLQVAPGESVLIESQGAYIAGIIERMETDLTGGFVSQVEIIGIVVYEVEGTEESMNNFLANGSFNFAQRQTPGTLTTKSNDTYGPDRWRMSRENTDFQYQRNDAHAESGLTSRYYGSFKKITSTGKLMVYQILEGANSGALKGKTVIFQARMKASSAKTIRMAVLELQNAGTMDTIPGTFVSAWGANSTDPTLGSNLAIVTAAQSKSVTTAWQNFSVSVTVPSNSKNVIVAVWSDSQFAANDILHIAEAGLYVSNVVQVWKPRPYAEDLLMCQRYYWKSFDIDIAPAQNAGNQYGTRVSAVAAGAVTHRFPPIFFPAPMFKAQTFTFYNPGAANAQARDVTAGADCTATAVGASTQVLLDINCTGPAGGAVNDSIIVAVTAEAEL